MIKNNYHTHTKYCNHATGEMEDYIKVAIDNNFEELGFSDHMPVPDELLEDEKYKSLIYLGKPYKDRMETEDVERYISELNVLKNKYSNQIKIFIGFECEYSEKIANIVKNLNSISDYLILGMHHFYVGDEIYNTYSSTDMTNERVIQYANECAKALDTGLFKYIAHPDLFMFNYMKNNGRLFTIECEIATRIIVEAAIKNNVYLELNVHEIEYSEKEGINPWRYPRKEFWDIVSEYKEAKVVIGMDAHKPEKLVNENYYKILNLANNCDIKLEESIGL
ncbi:MAG: histidinol-phosphatase [Clostridia bacterium]|nr:histidinol-phosphatase [Clostridia bacterium]